MPRPFPLQALLDLAQRRSEAAAVDLGQANARDRDAETQLAQLLQFRSEYAARFGAAARGGLEHGAWRNYQAFLSRLDEAIVLQRGAVEQARVVLAARRSRWQAEQRNAMTFDALQRRHREAQRALERRQEQREHDEHCAAKVAVARQAHAR